MKNYRGCRQVWLVNVLEGNGTQESPYKEVEYLVEDSDITKKVVQELTNETPHGDYDH